MKFLRQDYYKFKRLGMKWRKPKGSESKLRKSKRGSGKLVKIGHGSPNKGRINSLHPVIVSNISQLDSVDKSSQIIIISSGLGSRKSIALSDKAKSLGIRIFNNKKIRKAEKMMKAIEAKRKKKADEKAAKKEEKKQESKKADALPKKEETKK